VNSLLANEKPDVIVNFAAESHVDRSILSPAPVFETNLRGTFTLLEAARTHQTPLYIQVSTDEVYGSIDPPHEADENYPLRASSPYSASKAGADLLALSYFVTYKTPVSVTRASNNYGPYHFPEKLIPLMISNAMEGKSLPIYGDGQQIRDWLYVDDHARAILAVIERGRAGEIYNIGGSRHCNCSILEAIALCEEISGRKLTWEYVEDNRIGDHIWWISDVRKFREHYPEWNFRYGLREILGEIYAAVA